MAENWDDDFDVDGDINFRQSYMSTTSQSSYTSLSDMQPDDNEITSTKRIQRSPTKSNVNLRAYAEKDDEDTLDGLGTISVGSRMNELRHQASIQLLRGSYRNGIELPDHIKQQQQNGNWPTAEELDEFDDEFQTLKKRPAFHHENSLISGSLYEPPSPQKSKQLGSRNNHKRIQMPIDEDFEDGFDIAVDQSAKLTLANLQNLKKVQMNDGFEDELGLRTASRLSQISSVSTSTSGTSTSGTTNYDESETDAEAFDVGFDEVPSSQSDFQKRLADFRRRASQEAREEAATMARKYGKSATPKVSMENLVDDESADIEDAADFLEGLELNDDIDFNRGTIHRNAVVGGNKFRGSRTSRPRQPSHSTVPRQPSGPRKVPSMMLSNSGTITAANAPHFDATRSISRGESRVRSLRPVQSMANLNHQTIPHTKSMATLNLRHGSSSRNLRESTLNVRDSGVRKMRSRMFGDGSELDFLEDLPETPHDSTIRGVPSKLLETYKERPVKSTIKSMKHRRNRLLHTPVPTHSQGSPSPTRRSAASKPALIQYLGMPVTSRGADGDMRFNPQKQIWEGNDIELKKFDSVNKQPGLIAFISNKGVQIIGDMCFDPQNLRWVKVNDKKDEDEEDPFAGVEDLQDDFSQSRMSSRSSSSGYFQMKTSRSTPNIGQIAIRNEFHINREFVTRLQKEDERWARKFMGWFPPDEDIKNRDYLDEIRDMIMG